MPAPGAAWILPKTRQQSLKSAYSRAPHIGDYVEFHIIATPYSHSDPAVRRWRYDAACRATAAMLRMGISVFSPVVHSHPLTRYGLPGDWGFWEDYDRAHLERCDALAVLTLDGWRESEGLQVEMAIAKELSMPVRLIDPAEVGIRAENAPAAETGAPEVSD